MKQLSEVTRILRAKQYKVIDTAQDKLARIEQNMKTSIANNYIRYFMDELARINYNDKLRSNAL